MRYVIVSTTALEPLSRHFAQVLPRMPASVSVEVAPVPLCDFFELVSLDGATALVSPANSLSFMNRGFDRGILELWTMLHDELHDKLQEHALERANGYIVPGTAQCIALAEVLLDAELQNGPPVQWLVQAPTMPVPGPALLETVFHCCWSALLASRDVGAANVVMPAFGAGHGGLPAEVVAETMAAAVSLFHAEISNLDRGVAVLRHLQHPLGSFGEGRLDEMEPTLDKERAGPGAV